MSPHTNVAFRPTYEDMAGVVAIPKRNHHAGAHQVLHDIHGAIQPNTARERRALSRLAVAKGHSPLSPAQKMDNWTAAATARVRVPAKTPRVITPTPKGIFNGRLVTNPFASHRRIYGPKASKYQPHQGKREMARRERQAFEAVKKAGAWY